ncbi:unnamed protein product [Auanema sp. JU1783]|nr:unnamed protein product [Auanema sp. JU1783]
MIFRLYVCLLLTITTLACFLNSCPYRRYGRTLTCGSCGPHGSGACVSENKCCTTDICFESDRCMSMTVCPTFYCKISGIPGLCQDSFCCVEDECILSQMCY